MNKGIKFILIFILILGVIGGVYFYYTNLLNTNKSTATSTMVNVNENSSMDIVEDINNVVEEAQEENVVIEQNEVVDEQNKDEEIVANNEIEDSGKNTTLTDNESELESTDDEQKAIEIVKKDWGISDGVVYICESIDANGNYIISVRESTSRNAMAWYTVNPQTGEFSN